MSRNRPGAPDAIEDRDATLSRRALLYGACLAPFMPLIGRQSSPAAAPVALGVATRYEINTLLPGCV